MKEENPYIDQVIQFPDGSIDLQFVKSHSYDQISSSKRISFLDHHLHNKGEGGNILRSSRWKVKGVGF